MKVRTSKSDGRLEVELLDENGAPVEVVCQFLRYLDGRGSSPNTVTSYAYDLLHLWRFLARRSLAWTGLRPATTLDLLVFLRSEPSRTKAQRLTMVSVDSSGTPRLSPATVNRILTGVGTFYDWAIAAELFDGRHPVERRPDPSWRRVTDRHRPFIGTASRQPAQRRTLAVRQPIRLPRPLSYEEVAALFARLVCRRDRAMLLLMLQGGLRPGEVLGLHLGDIAYGRRRVFVRVRDDHPRGGALEVPGRARSGSLRAGGVGRGQRLRPA